MKNTMKKLTVLTLTASMFLSGTVFAEEKEREITREELEELKEELQEEINQYGELEFEFEESMEMIPVGSLATSDSMGMNESMMISGSDIVWSVAEADRNPFHTEEYAAVNEMGFVKVATDPLSTFAADVDTGSYCNFRRMLKSGYALEEIPSGSIRTEELLNYFDYEVEEVHRSDETFSLQYETTDCPWQEGNKLLLMTVEANETEYESAGNNFVYLLDTSGSMDYAEKIALAKCSFKLLSYTLTEKDRVSIVTYSGDSYVALESCPGNDYETICEAFDEIYPYGGTNGSGGITAAYELAQENFIEGGNNRVFIASDGDMNLGITDTSGLVDLIREEKESGVYLTVLGFGSGNYSDTNMESIADAGNGNYFYIDCLDEAQHVLIENQKQTTITVAKDVKFQVEFNPVQVAEYRLIGYENREVADDAFENDSVDGGEVGAGAQVTILYEYVPAGQVQTEESNLKYQGGRELTEAAYSDELLTLSINYKEPDNEESVTESIAVTETSEDQEASEDMNLAISLAELSMILHNSNYKGTANMEEVHAYAEKAQKDNNIYRMGYAYMLP